MFQNFEIFRRLRGGCFIIRIMSDKIDLSLTGPNFTLTQFCVESGDGAKRPSRSTVRLGLVYVFGENAHFKKVSVFSTHFLLIESLSPES